MEFNGNNYERDRIYGSLINLEGHIHELPIESSVDMNTAETLDRLIQEITDVLDEYYYGV